MLCEEHSEDYVRRHGSPPGMAAKSTIFRRVRRGVAFPLKKEARGFRRARRKFGIRVIER